MMLKTYIDHNIVDYLFKNPGSIFEKNITNNRRVIYSEENITEIERCGHLKEAYAKTLERLNPEYISIQFSDTGSRKDRADLMPYPVWEFIEGRRKIAPNFEEIKRELGTPLLKTLGGLKNRSLSEVQEAKARTYQEMAKLMGKNPDHYARKMAEDKAHTEEFLRLHENYAGVPTIRVSVGVSPLEINNIKPPCVIQKIWDKIAQSKYAKERQLEFDQFFGIENIPKDSEGNRSIFTKVNMLYLMLNAIGYKTDKKWLQDERYLSASSDGKHVAFAIFADEFLSMDRRLCEKARAVYAHAGVATKVWHLKE
jgi:hypothetical protein